MSETDHASTLLKLLPLLGESGIAELMPFLELKEIQSGNVLVKQGANDTDLYFLIGGMFSVFEKIRINRSNVVLQTATFPGPGILGEVNALIETVRSATVVSMQTSDCYVLTKAKFDQLTAQKPKLAIELLKAFGATMHARQVAFQHKVRGNILKESATIEGAIAKLGRYTGKVSRTPSALADKLFSADFEGMNYES